MPAPIDPEKRTQWLKNRREAIAASKHSKYHADFETNTKMCKQCQKTKTLSDFSPQDRPYDRLSYICRSCSAENRRKRRILHPRQKKEPIIPTGKICRNCFKFKPIEDYAPRYRNKDKHATMCQECETTIRRANQRKTTSKENLANLLKYKYRLSEEEYNQKFAAQNGVCAVCGNPETLFEKRTNTLRRLAIDHNHETGQIRDLLCHRCNQCYGRLKEDPELIKALLVYAEKWKS